MEHLVERLAVARIGATTNQYADSELRRERLRAHLDARADAPLVLVEAWADGGDAPADDEATFDVEGTIVGDGRRWQRVRFSTVQTAALPVTDEVHQTVVVRPAVNRWS